MTMMLKLNLTIGSIFVFLFIQHISGFGLPREWDSLDYKSWKDLSLRDQFNRVNCVYFRNESVLSCSGNKSALVECGAVLNFTRLDEREFYGFGIGLESSNKHEDMNLEAYHLYPILESRGAYLSHFIRLEEGSSEICMFFRQEQARKSFGIRVEREDCFNELRSFFLRSSRIANVEIASYLADKPTAAIVADLYIV